MDKFGSQMNQKARVESGRAYAFAVVAAIAAPAVLVVSFWKRRSERFLRFAITLLFTVFATVGLMESGDAVRHQLAVDIYYTRIDFSHFLRELWQILTLQVTDSGARDVYRHVVGYFFGGVLGMPQLFFPFVATVYGYFFAGSVIHVLRTFSFSKANYVVLGFGFVFLFLMGIDGFYTVRTWTGMWVLVYACLKYHETKKPRYLFLMFVPPFIHFGYFLMAIPAWVVLVFGPRPLIYSGLFVVSIFSNFLPHQPVAEQLASTERGQEVVGSYLRTEESVALDEFAQRSGNTNFYNAYRQSGLQRWAPTILALILVATNVYARGMNSYQKRIFSIGLVMLTLSNLTWFLYAVHNRTLTIATIFILAAYLMARLDERTNRQFFGLPPYYKWGVHLSLAAFVPLMMFQLSMLVERTSIWFLGAPVIPLLFPEANMSVKQALRLLF